MTTPLRVLVLAASPSQAQSITQELTHAGFDLRLDTSDSVASMIMRLEPRPDVILADDSMPKFTALRALQVLRERALDVPVLIVATPGNHTVPQFLEAGATDYVFKDRLEHLSLAVTHALTRKRLRDENRRHEEQLRLQARLAGFSAAVGSAFARDGPLGESLQSCAAAMVRDLDAALARIWTHDDVIDVLDLRASAGLYTHEGGTHGRIAVGETEIGRVAQERGPYLTNDVAADPAISDKDWARQHELKSFAALPLLIGTRLVGVVAIFAKQPFPELVVEALAAAANQLAVGIDHHHAGESLGRSEERFRQAQKMEAVGRLAGGVAHDFNNLLTIIRGYAEMLSEKMPATDPARDLLVQIMQAGAAATSLTRQLLTFSRQQVREVESLDLNAIVKDTLRMLKRLIGEDIQVVMQLAPTLCPVLADAGQINQIIMNLAVNGRDAMPAGGQLIFETANVDLDEKQLAAQRGIQAGPFVLLKVTDTGTGMDAATKQRIFEPFFTTKGLGKGTGLGLATVQSAVQQSGGFIAVDSEVGQGTSFRIYLPESKDAPAEREPAPIASHANGAGETILLVEDDEPVRRFAMQVLRARGYHILEAGSGADALALGFSHIGDIPLIVTDVVMPKMSGRVLADQLIAIRPQTAVLFMSGYTGEVITYHRVSEPGTFFLQKPFTADGLANKVREVLSERVVK